MFGTRVCDLDSLMEPQPLINEPWPKPDSKGVSPNAWKATTRSLRRRYSVPGAVYGVLSKQCPADVTYQASKVPTREVGIGVCG